MAQVDHHVILFEDLSFCGNHKHVFWPKDNLPNFNDKVSSIFVLKGNWTFYRDTGFRMPYPGCFEPCRLSNVEEHNIKDNDMSSLQPSSDPPDMPKDSSCKNCPQNAILFEHPFFHGRHQHVVSHALLWHTPLENRVSSVAIECGNWIFREKDHGENHEAGPGIYPNIMDLGLQNDRTYYVFDSGPTASHFEPHVILFKNRWFEDEHKHVFCREPNLNAPDDNSFNDQVESIVVLSGHWRFYRHRDFREAYDVVLEPGIYPDIAEYGINRNDMSSLEPV
jgi:hypothetical protein